ncbi:tumor necrosis factor receptor superfamily member 11B [Protopterus annectens]|uniref:tumor necrosis factor receptor superfamily member 11B n=1 Tax=Protopterus annectens TaxID=7888 RepID=UPI001CF983FA|nr:tumor necrosis factor receptor superfamily member 11B [Protopterus annectens]
MKSATLQQFPLLLLFAISSTSAVHVIITPPQYFHLDRLTSQGLFCNQCPPGTYVKSHCTAKKRTECAPCPDEHYNEAWNAEEECQFCDAFCKELQYVKQECNSTHKRICQCQEGYYLDIEFCSEHTKCLPGFGVAAKGTPVSDTVCFRCPQGFFSNTTSATDVCEKHTNCTQLGYKFVAKGNATHDSFCSRKSTIYNHPSDVFQKSKTDKRLCEEAVYKFIVPGELTADKMNILVSILPGRKLNNKDTERITQTYQFQEQMFQVLKLWKHKNEDNDVVKYIEQGIHLCRRILSGYAGCKNITFQNINMMIQSAPLKKAGKDAKPFMKTCSSRQHGAQLLSMCRLNTEDQDELKGITQGIKHLGKPLPKTFFRGIRKLIRVLRSSALNDFYQKVWLEITQDHKCNP